MTRAALLGLWLAASACSLNVTYGAGDAGGSAETPAATCATAIGTGGGHACAIRDDGVAWCWGDNSFGQLGNNSTALSATPVQVVDPSTLNLSPPGAKLPKLASITGGGTHTCAIDVGGNVWCWGANDQNQLGTGTAGSSYPVQVTGVTKAKKVVAGQVHTCALLEGGAISCWGNNDAGQLGNGGQGGHSTSPSTATLTGATALAARNDTTCAVDGAGNVQCWGANDDGQLGIGTRTGAHPAPVTMIGVAGAIDVVLGDRFSCALTGAGEVYCSGYNDVGQIGEPYDDGQPTPNLIPLDVKAVALAAADRVACVIDDARQLWCWGANDDYELADHTSQAHAFPVRSDFPDALEVSVGGAFVCVRSTAGLRCAGFDGTGALGDGVHTISNVAVAVPALTGVATVAAGAEFSCALLAAGTASCWGANDASQLGDATTVQRASPGPVIGLTSITKLVTGDRHACALLADKTVACWGDNAAGQLGDGAYDDHGQPRPVTSGADANGRAFAAPLANVVDLDAGGSHTCAVLADKTVRCWGSNRQKQLGLSANTYSSPVPVTVGGSNSAVAVVAGDSHSCLIDGSGAVWCWGSNGVGQLGAGEIKEPMATPVQVLGLTGQTIDQLSSAGGFTCAHATNNSVWCWGYNSDGEGGIDFTYEYEMAKQVPNLVARKVTAGGGHACAILLDGTLQCWGANYLGQITGDVYLGFVNRKVVDGAAGATDVTGGGSHTCAVVAGAVKCWGDGRDGQLGNGVSARQTPVAPLLTCP
ncbi:MAG TPA: hypothetical protein VGC42_24670 [Kofleriaceae bacterium]